MGILRLYGSYQPTIENLRLRQDKSLLILLGIDPICRAKKEFEMLLKVKSIGVHAPEPVVYFKKGRVFYRCRLMAKEIPNQGTIAHISLTDTSLAAFITHGLAQC